MYIEHDRFEQAFREIFVPEKKKEKLWGVWVEGVCEGNPVAHFLMDEDGRPHFTPDKAEIDQKVREKTLLQEFLELYLDVKCTFTAKEAPQS